MFHHMHFDHAERGARLIRHRVHGEIKTHRVRQQAFHLQIRVVSKWMGSNRVFTGHNARGGSTEASAW